MEGIDQNHDLIRLYLLGELGEAERERVELRVLADAGFKESVLAAEDELAEEYVEGALSEAEREKFEKHFLATPQQRRRVMVARALKEVAAAAKAESAGAGAEVAAVTVEAAAPATPLGGGGLRERLRGWWASVAHLPKPLLAAGVTALVVLAVLGVRFLGPWQEQRRRAAFEAELARLNVPHDSRPGAGRSTLPAAEAALTPQRTLRGPTSGNHPDTPAVVIAGEPALIRFRLGLLDGQYRSYRAVFKRKPEGETVGREATEMGAVEFEAGGADYQRAVVIDAPAGPFEAGDYLIQLYGRPDARPHEPIDDYPFRVVRR